MNYYNVKKSVIAVVTLFLNMQTIVALSPERTSQLTSSEPTPHVKSLSISPTGYSECPIYYPISWQYEFKNTRFADNLDVADTDAVIAALVNNTSALDNYKIVQVVMEYYKNHPDTPEMRSAFERIIATYFSLASEVEARDFYLFNLIYDMALKLAHSINFKAMADIMFKYAGSLNQQNQHGETPAHVFVKNAALAAGHFFEVLHLFLNHGANFTEIRDFAKKSVYDYMIERTVGYMMGDGFAKEITLFIVREYLKSQGFDLN